eukprot:6795505-Pyramimonas_sp.AAC.2
MPEEYALPNDSANSPCHKCTANVTDEKWNDYRQRETLWLDHLWDLASWLAANPAHHSIFYMPETDIISSANYDR